jgi:glycosyltransferase involved in cell wall biosynthesis
LAAHGLAMSGHEVHVVTNAKEAVAPFRMFMRAQDWGRCEAAYGAGSVTVHWTDPVDRTQAHIPQSPSFVTKLATLAARAHAKAPFDVIFSFYMEPYGVAGHLAAQMTGVPHVARMAGSDAGRLWHHPQFEAAYDHVLRSAAAVIMAGAVAERAVERGIPAERIAPAGGVALPADLFAPDGPRLDVAEIRAAAPADPQLRDLVWGDFAADRPFFGVYGKLGEAKGSFALLAAMARLKRSGIDVGLVALAHGGTAVEAGFRARATELGLADRILQIPFLPHWRVPEFLRSCLAVCCLEQGFPITFHAPMIPREVLLSGTCLIASMELIRKLPAYEQLPHGHGCLAVRDVFDGEALSGLLGAVARDPRTAAAIGLRGRRFALERQRDMAFPALLERTLEAAAGRRSIPHSAQGRACGAEANRREPEERFPLTRLAAMATGRFRNGEAAGAPAPAIVTVAAARRLLAILEQRIAAGATTLRPHAIAVATEIAIAAAEDEFDSAGLPDADDPLFRLRSSSWAAGDGDIAALVPVRDRRLKIIAFDHDVAAFLRVKTAAELPATVPAGPSHMIVFAPVHGRRKGPLVIDPMSAEILRLSDGTRSALQIAGELGGRADAAAAADCLDWIEQLFIRGLLGLRSAGAACAAPADGIVSGPSAGAAL